jgi:hypothetical protein
MKMMKQRYMSITAVAEDASKILPFLGGGGGGGGGQQQPQPPSSPTPTDITF